MMVDYEKFRRDVKKSADGIRTRESLSLDREGKAGWRDKLVSIKQFGQYGLQWLTIPKSFVMFLALIPMAITNLNYATEYIFGFKLLPVGLSSILAFVSVIGIVVFGYLGYTRGGTEKRRMEITGIQDPIYYMQWKKLEGIDKRLEKLEEKLTSSPP